MRILKSHPAIWFIKGLYQAYITIYYRNITSFICKIAPIHSTEPFEHQSAVAVSTKRSILWFLSLFMTGCDVKYRSTDANFELDFPLS